MSETSELNLGIVPDKTSSEGPCCPGPIKDDKEPRYPTLCFSGKHAKLFRDKYGNCAPGDEYEMTVKLKVKVASAGPEGNDWENKVEFDVTAIVGDVVEEEAEGEPEGEPMKEAKAPRKIGRTPAKEPAEKY